MLPRQFVVLPQDLYDRLQKALKAGKSFSLPPELVSEIQDAFFVGEWGAPWERHYTFMASQELKDFLEKALA